MEFQVWADGEKLDTTDGVPDKVQMMGMGDKGEDAYKRLLNFLETGELNNTTVTADVQPAKETEWGEPYEAFGSRTGSKKYIATTVLIDARTWIEMQANTHRQSVDMAFSDVTEATAEAVTEAIDVGAEHSLSEFPMPVLEIYMDNTSNHAEGRSRGVGVYRSSTTSIPVRVVSRVYR